MLQLVVTIVPPTSPSIGFSLTSRCSREARKVKIEMGGSVEGSLRLYSAVVDFLILYTHTYFFWGWGDRQTDRERGYTITSL